MTAMPRRPRQNHPPVKSGKVGVLLVNLGTPDGTDYTSMRRYLKEFLMDRRVIEWSRVLLVSDPLRHRAQHAAPPRSARPMRRSGTRT